METLVALYLFLVLGMPIISVLLVPLVFIIITLRNKYRYKSAEKRKQLIAEYRPPNYLTPAELGFLFDEHISKSEVWSSLFTASKKIENSQPITNYEQQAIHINDNEEISKLLKGYWAKFSVSKQVSVDYSLAILKFSDLLRGSLASKKIVISEEELKIKIEKRRKRYTYISSTVSFLTFFVPIAFLIVVNNLQNLVNAIMFILFLVVLWIIHSVMIYVSFMMIRHVGDKGPVLSLNENVINRGVWDELRGYRDYLKVVEAPRAKTYIELGDVKYLSSDIFAQLVAFNFVSNKLANKAYMIIKKQKK